jgi:hypothetical protein
LVHLWAGIDAGETRLFTPKTSTGPNNGWSAGSTNKNGPHGYSPAPFLARTRTPARWMTAFLPSVVGETQTLSHSDRLKDGVLPYFGLRLPGPAALAGDEVVPDEAGPSVVAGRDVTIGDAVSVHVARVHDSSGIGRARRPHR